MKYLVVGTGGPGFDFPEEALEVLEETILPSFKELLRLERAKKIKAGGLPVGDRTLVFILEAKTNEEADQVVRSLPLWGSMEWEVTPLQTFAGRAKQERQAVREIKRQLREGAKR